MNIDYAKIIEAANARKDALLRLNDLLQEMPGHLLALQSARIYSVNLYAALRNLDQEAQELVGAPGIRALHRFGEAMTGLYSNHLGLLDYPGGLAQGNGKTHLANIEDLLKDA